MTSTIGVLCKPLNQTRYLEQIITELEILDGNDEHYVIGDLNKPFFKEKYIFDKPNEFKQFCKQPLPCIKIYWVLFDKRLSAADKGSI